MSVVDIDEQSFAYHNTPGLSSRAMFYYVQSCGEFHCMNGYLTDRSNYSSFLLLYTTGGRGCLTYRGKHQPVGPGQLFLIDCMEHQLYKTDPNELWVFKFIHFNGSESKKYFERFAENGDFIYAPSENGIISSNIDRIIELLQKKDRSLDIKASCLIVEILTELLLDKGSSSKADILPDYISDAVNIIESEYAERLKLDAISKQLSINKYYLTRQFRLYTGKNLYEYIISCRLNQAKYLLKNTRLPVGEIAEKVGFESVSHFIKLFRQHEEITPNRFRQLGV